MCRGSGRKVEVVYRDPPRAEVVGCFCPLQKAKELVCRVQLVSARGDSPATQSGALEILRAASVCGSSGETARGGEGSFDGWARGEAVIKRSNSGGRRLLCVLVSRRPLHAARQNRCGITELSTPS